MRSDLEDRIERLERLAGVDKPEPKTWVLVKGEPVPRDIGPNDTVIWNETEEGRQVTLEILAGKRTE